MFSMYKGWKPSLGAAVVYLFAKFMVPVPLTITLTRSNNCIVLIVKPGVLQLRR